MAHARRVGVHPRHGRVRAGVWRAVATQISAYPALFHARRRVWACRMAHTEPVHPRFRNRPYRAPNDPDTIMAQLKDSLDTAYAEVVEGAD